MNRRHSRTRLLTAFATLALGASIGMSAPALSQLADPATQPAADGPKQRLDPEAMIAEIAPLPDGIHKLSDDSICVKSGPGFAIVSPDGNGCSVGSTPTTVPAPDPDEMLLAGVFHATMLDPKEAEGLGISKDNVTKLKNAYNYMDLQGTFPEPVSTLYKKYAAAPDGKTKDDAQKALMDKVQAVGQAYLDVQVKKHKDIKALLTPDQDKQLRAIGTKMTNPGIPNG